LREIKKILSGCGLSLGMIIPDFDTLRYKYEQSQIVDDMEDTSKGDNIDRKSFLNLFRKVSELCLSPRALNCINDTKITYIGNLVVRSRYDLLKIKNMGRKSVAEIESKLSCLDLYLGMNLPKWLQIKKVEEEIKLLGDELEMHKKNNANLFLPDIKHADFLEDELINFVEMFSKGKNISIVTSFLGFDGKGKKTLETTGEEFDITRERVRQITEKYLKNIKQSGIIKDTYLPICKNIEKYIMNRLPVDADVIEMELIEKGFTKTKFDLEGIIVANNLFNEKQLFDIAKVGGKRLIIRWGEIKIVKLIIPLSRRLISRYGITNVTEIIGQVFQKTGRTLTDKYVISVLSLYKDFRWLDESKGWFWIINRRNRVLNIIKKILSVCESIDIHELRAGIGRFHRMNGIAPITSVLLELCKQVSWCKVEGSTITANPSIKAEDVLGGIELNMYQILKNRGPLMTTGELETICFDSGIARNSINLYLSSSPILNRYIYGVYGLRGAKIPPGLAESIAQPQKRNPIDVDYGWTKEGNIWIVRELTRSAIRNGLGIPIALIKYIQEPFTLKSVDGTLFGNVQIDKRHVLKIYNFLNRRGCEAGDYIALIFYLARKEVFAYIGGEEIRDDFIA
jgi:hypothetical protein